MKGCHFCAQISGEEKIEKIVYEDDRIVIMDDDHPHGADEPMHLIVVGKEHMSNNFNGGLSADHCELISHIFAVASDLAIKMEIREGLTVRFLICKDRPEENSHFHAHLMCSKPLDPKFIIK